MMPRAFCCFVCSAPLPDGHRYCDCRPEPLCSACFEPHTAECPQLGVVIRDRDLEHDGDLGLEDDDTDYASEDEDEDEDGD